MVNDIKKEWAEPVLEVLEIKQTMDNTDSLLGSNNHPHHS